MSHYSFILIYTTFWRVFPCLLFHACLSVTCLLLSYIFLFLIQFMLNVMLKYYKMFTIHKIFFPFLLVIKHILLLLIDLIWLSLLSHCISHLRRCLAKDQWGAEEKEQHKEDDEYYFHHYSGKHTHTTHSQTTLDTCYERNERKINSIQFSGWVTFINWVSYNTKLNAATLNTPTHSY